MKRLDGGGDVSGFEKLDARSRQMLSEQSDREALPAEVSVLVRGERAFSEPELEALRGAGAQIRTVAGDVLTASVATEAIEELASQPFVVALEVSQPLYPDEPGAPPAPDVE
jgi:hypothetical protein